ncbi:hypothetical protein SDC9_209659 [bioreactor metagenome]|uniref:Uncharacterized protein n=1 Tax=bioreactor metagenome TaxID=1076179 RepID=A0A645JQY4_9ZZZZ
MLHRHNNDMHGRLRINILECDNTVGFVHNFCGQFLVCDLAENTVVHIVLQI